MSDLQQLSGRILTPTGWVEGTLAFDEKIRAIEAKTLTGPQPVILPGFIDTHVHGGGGADTMQGGDAVVTLSRLHARHGTTSLLATTMTAPESDIVAALTALSGVCAVRPPQAARVLGVHLEGPYINRGKLGAQPDNTSQAALSQFDRFNRIAPIRLVTIAPEIPGHLDIIAALKARGVRVQLGHTLGSYEDGVAALKHGAHGFTHLFNAMTGLHHREPGMVGAALAHAEYAELIPDLLHIHPGAMHAAMRAIPRLFCVTDSTAAAGMPDGQYQLGSHTVTKCLGGVRLADGTLAGSTLTMDQALRNLVSIGLDLADASHRLSQNPADYLGLADRGRLGDGCWADLTVFDTDLNLTHVYVEGESLVLADA
ncbi:MAG: N-acetylglucosamine-6-phosphate deacetylase [Paludibacterium sp.]|uniref:N-acetylglucosamine-6-phosphate deacetylase n=1 Tax=Paludibacterium sp. TaxID=1917523 RepID=UPI0025F9E555|nr:N-acetylglucosamine-6-phosphate deacetylase [Paludibacterium sp.]MBV8048601.1 N-acetylglucosamine-6-phosphate deacetylase [Paludibacterium sp.]MBV8647625.1 N-acetylglucosamine-6-phosphate deacetylase [Paludibacterium sp.]